MYPILLAGGAVAALFLLSGCSEKNKKTTSNLPPRPTPPAPDYIKDFNAHSEVLKFYRDARKLGVTDLQLDIGCPTIFYGPGGVPSKKIMGAKDHKIQTCEVHEYILNHWDKKPISTLAETLAGKPIPFSLDDRDLPIPPNKKIWNQAGKAIAFLDQLLAKQGLDPDSANYHERRILALHYLVAYPKEETIIEYQKEAAKLKREVKRDANQEDELNRYVITNNSFKKLSNKMAQEGLEEFQKYRENHGGFYLDSELQSEYTALKAIENNAGACTEFSKILFGLLKIAGYDPYFIAVDPWKTQHPGIKTFIQEDPLYWHVVIGLKIGEKEYVLDPTLADPDAVHKEAGFPLSLRQYLALDFFNQGIDHQTKSTPDLDEARNAIDKGLHLDDQSFYPLMMMGATLFLNGFKISDSEKRKDQMKKSVEHLDRAIAINPYHGSPYYFRSRAKIELGLPGEARADINQAIKLNPNVWNFYFTRAGIHASAKDVKGMHKDLVNSIRLSPHNARLSIERIIESQNKDSLQAHPQRKVIELVGQELSMEVFKLLTQFKMATLLYQAGHASFAQQELEKLIVTLEKAKKNFESNGKSFSPATVSFLQTLVPALSDFPQDWQGLKDRYAKLPQP